MNANDRLHSLDGLRGVALILGVGLHGAMSFVPGLFPGIWATVDNAPTPVLGGFFFTTHTFRMTLFFVIAGFFARLLMERRGVAGFWGNRLVRIGIPLVAGWCLVYPLIGMVWKWGLTLYFDGKLPAMPTAGMKPPPGAFPLVHLWFLYMLLLLYVGASVVRAVFARLDRRGVIAGAVDRALRVSLRAGAAPFALAAPVATVLYLQPKWLPFVGVPTPDQSLIPPLASLVAYGFAVAVGWALHRRKDVALDLLARRWLANLAIGAVAAAVAMSIIGTSFSFRMLPMGLERAVMALAYCVATWGLTFGLMGVALRFFAGESRVRRYVADASYFVYIAHLPVVAAFDVVVARWNAHWTLKFGFVVAASLAVLFAAYHLLVRWTFVGQVLNGRRVPLFGAKATVTAAGERIGPTPVAGDVAAELRGVSKRYGRQLALDGVDLQLHRGELLALLGPNGAGKSTAIGLWLGLHEADAGVVTLAGGSPLDVDRRRRMGVMMQDVALANGMRVGELVAQTSSYYSDARPVDETLKVARIEALAGRLYDKLSGGQKRQVQFALAICGRPSVLFLDEPSVGLDLEARTAMWETIRALLAEGCSIVLTTHYLEEAEALADRVAVLAQGRVVACGSVDDIRSLVSRREIRCRSTVPVETLRAWPGVLAASGEAQGGVKLTVVDAEAILRRLFAADADVTRLEVRQAGLAEAFTHLTLEAA